MKLNISSIILASCLTPLQLIAMHPTCTSRPTTVKIDKSCTPHQEPINLGTTKNAIRTYYTSGNWEAALVCVEQKSIAILKRYIPVKNRKLAVVFDIDETSLSNWEYADKVDFRYNPVEHKAWENLAQAEAIKPILNVYNFARDYGFAVFFITGRRENQREATALNLRRVGFNHWNGLFLKPLDYNQTSAAIFKGEWRAHIERLGYLIVLNIGDQMSDFFGSAPALFNIKISNPMYYIP